ncbi:unnamed protein product [Arctia plantaginis]|uniref:Uncharacterized protein n=1 Tax=Arctia plantaginis TaxID=874455 RepID=A0A8S1B7F6_ARCPL|nr:unnamed protein product [Arctia plantaginis]
MGVSPQVWRAPQRGKGGALGINGFSPSLTRAPVSRATVSWDLGTGATESRGKTPQTRGYCSGTKDTRKPVPAVTKRSPMRKLWGKGSPHPAKPPQPKSPIWRKWGQNSFFNPVRVLLKKGPRGHENGRTRRETGAGDSQPLKTC